MNLSKLRQFEPAPRCVASYTYAANCLNQYTAIQEDAADSASLREPTYDGGGNMLSDGVYTYSYDAANRLATVSSNGVGLVANAYDAKSRRVSKATPTATHTYFYEDYPPEYSTEANFIYMDSYNKLSELEFKMQQTKEKITNAL